MAQSTDITISPGVSGTGLRTEQNDINAAIASNHSGAARPTYLPADGMWIQDTGGTSVNWYFFDGTDDILLGIMNKSSNVFTPAGQLGTFGNFVVGKTGAFTAVDADYSGVFACNATGAAFSAAIAAWSSLRTGWFSVVQKIDSTANAVTIDPNSTETINGATTLALTRQGDACIIVKASTGTFVGLYLSNGAQLAPLDSPAFTNAPTAPTPSPGDSSTKLATTAFVALSFALLASPAFTGNPTVPTQLTGNNTTRIASTAFVQQEIAANVPTNLIKVVRRQTILASGTYTPHPNAVYVDIEMRGGGGNGVGVGSASTGYNGGAGGGEGGYVRKVVPIATIGASQSVTIGGPGGTSLFGSIVNATGGSNGTGTNGAPGGLGGIGTGGDINLRGAPGGSAYLVAIVGVNQYHGFGSGEGGGEGGGNAVSGNVAGIAGVNGGGGSGAMAVSAGARAGGAGGNGWCIVTEYCTA